MCYKGTALYEDNLKDILTSYSCVAKITCISMIVLRSKNRSQRDRILAAVAMIVTDTVLGAAMFSNSGMNKGNGISDWLECQQLMMDP